MHERLVSDGKAGSTTTSGDRDVLPGGLVLVAAAAGLVWALAADGSSEEARNENEHKSPPAMPKQLR